MVYRIYEVYFVYAIYKQYRYVTELGKNQILSDQEIRSDRYKIKLSGDFENLDVTLAMPKKAVMEAKNPGLRISGTPLVINVKGKVKDDVEKDFGEAMVTIIR